MRSEETQPPQPKQGVESGEASGDRQERKKLVWADEANIPARRQLTEIRISDRLHYQHNRLRKNAKKIIEKYLSQYVPDLSVPPINLREIASGLSLEEFEIEIKIASLGIFMQHPPTTDDLVSDTLKSFIIWQKNLQVFISCFNQPAKPDVFSKIEHEYKAKLAGLWQYYIDLNEGNREDRIHKFFGRLSGIVLLYIKAVYPGFKFLNDNGHAKFCENFRFQIMEIIDAENVIKMDSTQLQTICSEVLGKIMLSRRYIKQGFRLTAKQPFSDGSPSSEDFSEELSTAPSAEKSADGEQRFPQERVSVSCHTCAIS